MSDTHFHVIAFQLVRQAAHIRFPIVIGKNHFGFDEAGCANQLFRGHGVGLVAGEEGNVNVFDVSHFRYQGVQGCFLMLIFRVLALVTLMWIW